MEIVQQGVMTDDLQDVRLTCPPQLGCMAHTVSDTEWLTIVQWHGSGVASTTVIAACAVYAVAGVLLCPVFSSYRGTGGGGTGIVRHA